MCVRACFFVELRPILIESMCFKMLSLWVEHFYSVFRPDSYFGRLAPDRYYSQLKTKFPHDVYNNTIASGRMRLARIIEFHLGGV